MGMGRIAALTAALLRHLPGVTLAAVVRSASLPQQAQLLTTLERLAADVEGLGIVAPGVILIGGAVREAQLQQFAQSHAMQAIA